MGGLEDRRPIFVGGTGRSGTTIFYRGLGRHSKIHVFPNEMRFLIDPGGLIDLVDSCTSRYSPARARDALQDFETLMRLYLTVPERPPYRGFDLANWLGGEYYWERLNRFCAEFSQFQFEGIAWQIEAQHEGRLVEWAKTFRKWYRSLLGLNPTPFRLTLPRDRLKVVKAFVRREEAIELAAEFVDDLFGQAARAHDKCIWCEKTPHNIFYLHFLWELFPESVFVHIKRDPRGVVHSMMKPSWSRSPKDIEGVCLLLKNMYERWFQIRRNIAFKDHSYVELKIEDVAMDPSAAFGHVAQKAGLDNSFQNLPHLSLDRLNEWQTEMPKDELRRFVQTMGDYIEGMGYQI